MSKLHDDTLEAYATNPDLFGREIGVDGRPCCGVKRELDWREKQDCGFELGIEAIRLTLARDFFEVVPVRRQQLEVDGFLYDVDDVKIRGHLLRILLSRYSS
ncbi:hypothetical protein [Desulfotalea psychrophila]|uniref:Uncharacterized protein n=1 Tax=Desulfotalea psychrophila (strain LSv54 / DSM 12343) TaxID=177439 RepID=Q6AMV9_DESPS|nr:hypothetical protein [Desulfotalea psychrophila]CAG36315.1 unknown protein [Desulfotalea psychrophila LSv54]